MRDQFTREEAQRVLEEAAEQPKTVTLEEVQAAGAAVGIEPGRVEAVAKKLEEKRSFRVALQIASAAAAVLVAAILLAPKWSHGSRTLPIHNRDYSPVQIDVLVPIAPTADCNATPDARFPADHYCVARSMVLSPNSRTRIGLPASADECPQAWLRAKTRIGMQSAVFLLPVHVEIERDGTLDHKGLGAPNMFGAPIGEPPARWCGGGS